MPLALRAVEHWQPALRGAPNENPFCELMARSNRICAACLEVQRKLTSKVSDRSRTVTCFAGLSDSAVPIRVGDQLIGFLQTGQVLLKQPKKFHFDRVAKQLVNWGVDVDLSKEPIGKDKDGKETFLRDLWPSLKEVRDAMQSALKPEVFRKLYRDFADQNPKWNEIPASAGEVYQWDEKSDYIHEPPFFKDFSMEIGKIDNIVGARALGIFGDSVTTDHISPAGAIKATSPAGEYLKSRGIKPEDFNSYGSRRGNDLVMTRGTFANVRIKNLMVPGTEGGVTKYFPDGDTMSIFDAAMKYQKENVPLVILAGHEYGTGSSRDWAAKGTRLLGVKAVVAASFERIHRSNLVGMGVLPLQFLDGVTAQSLGLDGSQTFSIDGLSNAIQPGQRLTMEVENQKREKRSFPVKLRIDTPIEVDYYRHGGILPFVLRQLLAK